MDLNGIRYTDRAQKALELSLREALQLGHNYVGTEHLLLGLLREGEGIAAKALARLDLPLNLVRQAVIQELNPPQPEPEKKAKDGWQFTTCPADDREYDARVRSVEFALTFMKANGANAQTLLKDAAAIHEFLTGKAQS